MRCLVEQRGLCDSLPSVRYRPSKQRIPTDASKEVKPVGTLGSRLGGGGGCEKRKWYYRIRKRDPLEQQLSETQAQFQTSRMDPQQYVTFKGPLYVHPPSQKTIATLPPDTRFPRVQLHNKKLKPTNSQTKPPPARQVRLIKNHQRVRDNNYWLVRLEVNIDGN